MEGEAMEAAHQQPAVVRQPVLRAGWEAEDPDHRRTASVAGAIRVSLLQPRQVILEPIEAGLPELAIVLQPPGDVPHRTCLQPAGPELGILATGNQPCMLEHL